MTDNALRASQDPDERLTAWRTVIAAHALDQLPSMIRSVESSQIIINMDPDILPYRLVKPHILRTILGDRYSLHLEPPDIREALEAAGGDPDKLSDDDYLTQVSLLQETPTVTFVGGRLSVDDVHILIENVTYTQENIAVSLSGPYAVTDTAKKLAEEAFEVLWEASGAAKRWSSKDAKNQARLMSYGTRTKVDLGIDLLNLLAPKLTTYLNASITQEDQSGRSFAGAMMSVSAYDGFEERKQIAATIALDDLQLKISTYDRRTGRGERANLRFSVTTLDELGRGVVDIISEMPFDRHVAFIQGLAQALRQDGDAR